jgi:iron complex outermembrane recepter protein
MKFYLLLFISLFAAFENTFAQNGKINGSISGIKEPAGTVVSLLRAKDSVLVKTSLCEADGVFEFNQLKDGSYLLTVSYTGYAKYISDKIEINQSNAVQLPVIEMKPAIKDLQEVKVTAKKPFVERRIDRVVINPEALISNAGVSSLEVLEKAPGVMVDANGVISFKGKQGVMVFIDDKPSYLTGQDLANYLRSLPSSAIESVELMTNPPAKYDAAGNAGIINIRLKKNVLKGVNGALNLSYGQGRYHRTNNSFNINYRINKFNFFSNLSWNQNNSYQDLTINRFYFTPQGVYNSGFTQNTYLKRELSGTNIRLGADYYINKKTTAGIVLSGFANRTFSPITNNAKVLDNNNNPVTLVAATNPSDRKWKNGSINLNYSYKIDNKGKEISANADYLQYDARITQNLTSSNFTPGNILTDKSILESNLPATLSIQTAKVDYVQPLPKSAKFEAGVKTSFVNTDNTAAFFDVVNNVSTPNYDFSNRFRYNENINAAYINYSRDWKTFSLQSGLRMENTNIKGNQLGNPVIKDSSFTRNYTNFFPTFYLQYRADSVQKNIFGFSLGRRINRPNYQDMNPFTYPLDRYTYYGGNPFLQPTLAYYFELTHTFKNKITTSIDYSITDNIILETNEQRGNIFYSRPGNFGKQVSYGMDVNANLQLAKWWTLIVYTELRNVSYQSLIYGQVLDERRYYWYIGPTNQFTITKNLSAELAGSYQTRVLVAQFLTIPVWQMRAGISQKIMKGKGSLRLNVSDLFFTNQPGGDIRNIANAKANWLSILDSRVATLSFSYRFAKGKSLNARKSGGSDDEKGRIKTN